MKIIVVGAGETGQGLANLLVPQKHEVTLVEQAEELAKSVASETDALVIKGDGTDISVLQDAGLDKADVVVAATHDDKTNFLIAQIAKTSKVNKIIAKVNSPKNEQLFSQLGIKTLVPIVAMTLTKVQQMLSQGDERIIAELDDGKIEVVELSISEDSILIDKPAHIPNAVIGVIYREGELNIPTQRTTLKKGDMLILTVKTEDFPKVKKMIEGE